ncbi:MAG: hypothetical protein A2W99_03470 [Bacteroidetes bacterium GWF2_33_16]|nr:MAG: hypothetical protein A2X00_11600 [Bacteroidetes bacterium GWE2_32_14]OFY08245.1 MAG: hypothetical protein A2W99_03470 [Bacteroidetes bacterium GWF2_33_16]
MKISIIYHSETGNVKKMAEIISKACLSIENTEVELMTVERINTKFLQESKVVFFGSPTYCGNCSWQIKKYLDYHPKELSGKLGAVFISQNQLGGGGASFAAISIISELLVCGMLVYSSGIAEGNPILHFGAISQKAPAENSLDYNRCIKLGERVTLKAFDIFK